MAAAGLAVLTVALAPETARACGGFFCNNSMPTVQSGERIVFSVEEDGTTTTHVQILYEGPGEAFAWIVPVPSLPELSAGTDALFTGIDQATAPQFRTITSVTGTCRQRPVCSRSSGGRGGATRGGSDGGGGLALDGASGLDGGPSVEVHLREAVGPYDAAVISSDDPDALRVWLADNDYDIPTTSLPLIDHYVEKGDFFVALKLLTDRSAGEIQPIVLHYEERQPCIPIRLTAIAATRDMPITAWVLGDARALPYNYSSLLPPVNDPALFMGGGASYTDFVTAAVDDAGGRAFVTDYAGDVPELGLSLLPVDELRTLTDPGDMLNLLRSYGYAGDAQLLGLLIRHIPPPDAGDAQTFYNCVANDWCHDYDTYLETLTVDADALADDIDALITTPRAEAQAMLERHTKATRLYTTMSPHEMTEDPVFVLRDSAPDVSRFHFARLVTECSSDYLQSQAPQKLVLPNDEEVVIREGTPYRGDSYYCPDGVADGGMCSVSEGGGGGPLALLAGLGVVLLVRRRRQGGGM